jgi:hypothetical protein
MYEDPGSVLPPGTDDWGEEGGDYQGDLGEEGGEGDEEEGEEEEGEEEEGDGFDECVVSSIGREGKSKLLIVVPGNSPRRSWSRWRRARKIVQDQKTGCRGWRMRVRTKMRSRRTTRRRWRRRPRSGSSRARSRRSRRPLRRRGQVSLVATRS